MTNLPTPSLPSPDHKHSQFHYYLGAFLYASMLDRSFKWCHHLTYLATPPMDYFSTERLPLLGVKKWWDMNKCMNQPLNYEQSRTLWVGRSHYSIPWWMKMVIPPFSWHYPVTTPLVHSYVGRRHSQGCHVIMICMECPIYFREGAHN